MKKERGITLIALIITIIVMLILVGVTVNVALNGGLFDTAQNARQQTEKHKILEEIIAMSEWTSNGTIDVNATVANVGEKYTIEGNAKKLSVTGRYGTYKYKITEKEIKILDDNVQEGGSFEKYILGQELEGRDISEIMDMDNMNFVDDTETSDVDESEWGVTFLTTGEAAEGYNEGNLYVKYDNKAYKVEYDQDEDYNITTKSCNIAYEENENTITIGGTTYKEGDAYTLTGSSGTIECTVIKVNNDSMEVVTNEELYPDGTRELKLGYWDETIDWDELEEDDEIFLEANIDGNEGISDVEKAIYSYNHAIETINKGCKEAIDTAIGENSYEVRSVGAGEDPTSTMYNGIPSTWTTSTYNGKGKKGDIAYEQDWVRMNYFGINNVNESYWMASRFVSPNSSGVYFCMRFAPPGGELLETLLWDVKSSYASRNEDSYAVRAVVSLSML